jgi:hypothetical protein
MEAGLSKNGHA